MITIEQPAMVWNCIQDWYIPDYKMQNSYQVDKNTKPYDIISNTESVALGFSGSKIKNLIINSHGSPGKIYAGTGIEIKEAEFFKRLAGKVETIWIIACNVAYIEWKSDGSIIHDGNMFISAISQYAMCKVKASTAIQKGNPFIKFGQIDDWEGDVYTYYNGAVIEFNGKKVN